MSGGTACRVKAHKPGRWVVAERKASYSAFNGYRRTPSDWSQMFCQGCGACWRTKAAYVDTIPDGDILIGDLTP